MINKDSIIQKGWLLMGAALCYFYIQPVYSEPSPVVSVAVSPAPSPTPSATVVAKKFSFDEKRKLVSEFRRAQSNELQALTHRQDKEKDEMDASHKARIKELKDKERSERRAFFEKEKKGAERRKYVKEMLERLQTFEKLLKTERETLRGESKVKLTTLKNEQKENHKSFRAQLEKGVKPGDDVWPKVGR